MRPLCLVDNGGLRFEVIRPYLTQDENGGLRLHAGIEKMKKRIMEDPGYMQVSPKCQNGLWRI